MTAFEELQIWGFPVGASGKESAYQYRRCKSRLGRSFRVGNGSLLQYSCLENPMDRRVWQATVHAATELDTIE